MAEILSPTSKVKKGHCPVPKKVAFKSCSKAMGHDLVISLLYQVKRLMDPPNPHFYSLDGAVGDTYSTPEYHTCTFYRPCKYPGSSRGFCSSSVSCGTVPSHFSNVHGIVRVLQGETISCEWSGCGQAVLRHNFVRHIRQRHLGHHQ